MRDYRDTIDAQIASARGFASAGEMRSYFKRNGYPGERRARVSEEERHARDLESAREIQASMSAHEPSARSEALTAELRTARTKAERDRAVERFMSAQPRSEDARSANVETSERPSPETAFRDARALVNEAIKDAVGRGVPHGISGDSVGQMIPPPPSFDPFHGKVCLAPGVRRNGLGNPKICGRQAVAVLRTFAPSVPERLSDEEQIASLNAKIAMQAYAGTNARIYAGGGPSVGSLVPGPNDPFGDDSLYVCAFHVQSAYKSSLHPDDNDGSYPDVTPAREEPLMGLSHLDPARQFRTVCSDPNVCSVTDGVTTVLVRTKEYIAYLRDNGSLPVNGQPL